MISITNILVFLLTISILVLIHEYGHFFVAKRVGMVVERFSLGFGPAILSWRGKDNVEYVLCPILLGGYVKLNEESYSKAALWARLAVMAAGVVANLILAILIFWAVFFIGIRLPRPIIGKVAPGSIAYRAGLRAGEEIKAVDGKRTHTWQRIAIAVMLRIGDKGYMQINKSRLDLQNWRINELRPDPLGSLGIKPYFPFVPAKISSVLKNSPAEKIGIRADDKILSVDGNEVKDWYSLLSYIQKNPGAETEFWVQRGAKRVKLTGKLGYKHFFLQRKTSGFLGVMPPAVKWPPEIIRRLKFPVGKALLEGVNQTFLLLHFNYAVIGKLFLGRMSYRVLGGPVTIFVSAGQAFQQGFFAYFIFLALLSIMLAFVNMLPIPALDGGNFVLLLFEGIFRRPLPEKVQIFAIRLGILLLALIIFIAVGNDLLRLFR